MLRFECDYGEGAAPAVLELLQKTNFDQTPGYGEDEYCAKADFVFNLAGVNRPKVESEFMAGNFGFASTLLDTLKAHGNTCPVMLSSSTPYRRLSAMLSGSIPKKLPTPMDGSKMLPDLKPIFSTAS